jgi:5-methylcytosine-specific restriction endonuclease McrA
MTHGEALKRFWGQAVQPGANVLRLLREAASWHVECHMRYIDRRLNSRRLPRPAGECFVCCAVKATQNHHVIAIINGGRSVKKNLVGVCSKCHRSIHPWMNRKNEPAPLHALADRPSHAPPRLVKHAAP